MAFRIYKGLWQFQNSSGAYETKYKINTSGQIVETDAEGNETAPLSSGGGGDATSVGGYSASSLLKLAEWNGNLYAHTDGRIYATIFYDSNDSGWYVDPRSTSRMNTIYCGDVYNDQGGWFRNYGTTGIYNQSYGTHFYSNGGANWAITGSGGNIELEFRSNHQSTLRGWVYATTSNEIGFLSEDGNWVLRTWNRGVEAYGSMRAPIFYDSNNTGYYGDFASTSVLNEMTANYIGVGQGTNGNYRLITNGAIYANGGGNIWAEGRFKQYRGSGTWYDVIDSGNIGDQSVNYSATTGKTNGQGGYPHAGTGMFAFYNWGGSNGGASAPTDSSYTIGISVGSHPGDQAYGFQIGRNMWNTGLWTRGYDSGWGSWVRLIDSSNIGDQSVSYASSAGNADTVDGWHRDDIRAWGNLTGVPSTFTPSAHNHDDVVSNTGVFASATDGGRDCYLSIGDDNPSEFGYDYGGLFTFYGDTSRDASVIYAGGGTFNRHLAASIFYDVNDSNYYLDLNSTSNSAMRIRGGTLYGPNPSWGTYLYVGTDGRVGTSATVAVTNGNLHIDCQDGYALYLNWYSQNNIYTRGNLGVGSDSASYRLHVHGTGYATSDFRAPIFYDSDNTDYYVDPNGNSRMGDIHANYMRSYGNARVDSRLYMDQNYGSTLVGVYSSYRFQGIWTMGDSWHQAFDGTSLGNLYGLSWSHPNAGGEAGNLSDHGLLIVVNGNAYAAISNDIWARRHIKAGDNVYVGAAGGWITDLLAGKQAAGSYATAAQGTNADTAYGWGNHASAGYITSTSSVSGGSAYLTGGDSAFYGLLYASLSGDLNTYNSPGLYSAEYIGSTNRPFGQGGHFIQISDAGGTDVKTQWYYGSAGADIAMRLMWGNGEWKAWRTLVHDGNIGSQSVNYATSAGNADTVDGWHRDDIRNAGNLTNQSGMWTSDARPGAYRLYRNDDNSAYNVQTTWSADVSGYWSLRGYYNDDYHAACYVARSGYADSAGSAGSVAWGNVSSRPTALSSFTNDLGNYGGFATHRGEGTNYIDYSRYVYNNGAYSGSGWIEPSDLGVRYAYYGRLAYNNGAYSGSGWVEPSDLGVRYANSAGSASSASTASVINSGYVVTATNNIYIYDAGTGSGQESYRIHHNGGGGVFDVKNQFAIRPSSTDFPEIRYILNDWVGYFWYNVDPWGDNWGIGPNPYSWAFVNRGSMLTFGFEDWSDRRHKSAILEIDNAVDKVKAISGYTYWKRGSEVREGGVIAQDVLEVFPEAVGGNEEGYSIKPSALIGLLSKAVKEQQEMIDALTARIEALENK